MPAMAAAQYCSVKGDIAANVASHLLVMQRAGELGVGFLLFPVVSKPAGHWLAAGFAV